MFKIQIYPRLLQGKKIPLEQGRGEVLASDRETRTEEVTKWWGSPCAAVWVSHCTGFGWDRVDFLHRYWYVLCFVYRGKAILISIIV